MVVTALFAGASVAASSTSQSVVLYSVATSEQYVNNADDRARGRVDSPFGNFHDTAPSAQNNKTGPFPGDEAIYQFTVYQGATLKTKLGAATFSCQYNQDKTAYCLANYSLKSGTIAATGAFAFDASSFTIPIVAGTGSYRQFHGELKVTPAANRTQRLVFTTR